MMKKPAALVLCLVGLGYALVPDQQPISTSPPINRREALISATTATAYIAGSPQLASSDDTVVDMTAINAIREKAAAESAAREAEKATKTGETSIDMNKINAARSSTPSSPISTKPTVIPIADPPPLLGIRGGPQGKSNVKIPRVGYSFYKTPSDQASRCTSLALRAGIKHLDVASAYGSNSEISKSLKKYLDVGLEGKGGIMDTLREEKPELLEQLDAIRLAGDTHVTTIGGGGGNNAMLAPPPQGSMGRRGRRDQLFISHKLSNEEQSIDPVTVRRSVKAAIATLGCQYFDMVSIHSPLTDKSRRLATYEALMDLRDSGFVKTVGVCNYGLGPLQELVDADLELPSMNQLELSPFNQHSEIVEWCSKYGVAIGCSAWSKLSGADGPSEGWSVVSDIAQKKGMTKAQVLARWSIQSGYVCVPRSASASKIERSAIGENSYGGINMQGSFKLTNEEMTALNKLNINYKAGKLGRRDGWNDSDVTGVDWDPTNFV